MELEKKLLPATVPESCLCSAAHPSWGNPAVAVPGGSLRVEARRVEMSRQELVRTQHWLPSYLDSVATHKHPCRCLSQ